MPELESKQHIKTILVHIEKNWTDNNILVRKNDFRGRFTLKEWSDYITQYKINTFFCNCLMQSLLKDKNPGHKNLAHNIYDLLIEYSSNDFYTANIIITAAGSNNDYKFAQQVFQDAVKNNQADVVTYSSMITAAGSNNDYKFAKQVFQDAVKNNQADVVTYNSMITAAGSNNDYKFAKQVFQDAVKNSQADVVTTTKQML